MPKKTKKEKLLAQQHRSHVASVVTRNAPESDSLPASNDSRILFSLPKRIQSPTRLEAFSANEFAVTRRDLIKTIVLTIVVLMSEFLLAKTLPQ